MARRGRRKAAGGGWGPWIIGGVAVVCVSAFGLIALMSSGQGDTTTTTPAPESKANSWGWADVASALGFSTDPGDDQGLSWWNKTVEWVTPGDDDKGWIKNIFGGAA